VAVSKTASVLRAIGAFLLGLLPGFFLVFNLLFADGSNAERFASYWVVVVAYGLLGFVAGLVWPHDGHRVATWLALPAALFALFILVSGELQMLVHAVLLPVVAYLSAWLAAAGGERLRGRRKAPEA
jgi:hypothetical protein